jgi:hypothetical protein
LSIWHPLDKYLESRICPKRGRNKARHRSPSSPYSRLSGPTRLPGCGSRCWAAPYSQTDEAEMFRRRATKGLLHSPAAARADRCAGTIWNSAGTQAGDIEVSLSLPLICRRFQTPRNVPRNTMNRRPVVMKAISNLSRDSSRA